MSFPKLTKSTALRLARQLLGSNTWIREYNGGYRVYTELDGTRTVYGEGATLFEALKDTFVLESELRDGTGRGVPAEEVP